MKAHRYDSKWLQTLFAFMAICYVLPLSIMLLITSGPLSLFATTLIGVWALAGCFLVNAIVSFLAGKSLIKESLIVSFIVIAFWAISFGVKYILPESSNSISVLSKTRILNNVIAPLISASIVVITLSLSGTIVGHKINRQTVR